MLTLRRWLWKAFVESDRFLNWVLGGRRDRTISARLGLAKQRGDLGRFGLGLCHVLDRIDPDHCFTSAEKDKAKRGKL